MSKTPYYDEYKRKVKLKNFITALAANITVTTSRGTFKLTEISNSTGYNYTGTSVHIGNRVYATSDNFA